VNGSGAYHADRMALRLGVTGHRSLLREDALRRQVNLAIDQALDGGDGEAGAPGSPGSPGSPGLTGLTVVSALAEGADRLVVRECLRREGATLLALLPLPIDDYVEDFGTEASRREFDDLLGQAVSVEFAEPMPSREESYERAGQLMVDRSDTVIALWDGRPAAGRGGTGDIVAYAVAHHVPVIRIASRNAHR
jgi:hypothetical protein